MAPPKTNPATMEEWLATVRTLLSYNPYTGDFKWLQHRVRFREGLVAGSVNSNGYLLIVVGGRKVRAHRLAWLFMHGELPPKSFDIDHINGNRTDNRFINLRLATRSQNLANRDGRGKHSAYHGVCFDKSRQMWMAQGKAGSAILKKRFNTEVEAARAYDAFARKHHGAFARVNFAPEK